MQLAQFPRLRFAHLPTPIECLERLSSELGGPTIYVKRDDATGLAMGGNKTRKLEFLLAEAKDQQADTLITCGGIQSNHVRQTAAAAARLGFACEVVLYRAVPRQADDYEATGNVLLDHLFGARVHMHDGGVDRNAAMAAVADRVRSAGGTPYVVPYGGSNGTGALGYVQCALEIERQANERNVSVDAVITAASSGGTQAGLIAGFKAINSRTAVIGIDVNGAADATAETVRSVLAETHRRLDLPGGTPADAVVVEPGYAGPGYGVPTRDMVAAVTLTAAAEGLVLDPVYTGKAMAGLMGLIRTGRLSPEDTVVFLHTGGSPALFAYRSEFDGT